MTKTIKVGDLFIGGGNKIVVQSMTNTSTKDVEKTVSQITVLEKAGCDIVRLAVSDNGDITAAKEIISMVSVPLVADIQFDYKIAVKCCEIGFAKIRINPGNIGSNKKVSMVASACKANGVPLRIGVNSGSIEDDITEKFGRNAAGLAESALRASNLIESFGLSDIILSVKSSNVKEMVEANRILHKKTDYPLHIGVTESGFGNIGLIKSSVGIGALLLDGIGDTIRVSLSDDPVKEVTAAKNILRALRIDPDYCEIISCPTCSRCSYDLISLVKKVEELTKDINKNIKIAVMGCVVNGPGEAKDADIGIAGGTDKAVLFKKGNIVKTIRAEDAYIEIKKLIEEYLSKHE